MRDDIRQALNLDRSGREDIPSAAIAEHMGLAYGSMAPTQQSHEAEPGKVDTDIQDDWFDKLQNWSIPEDYEGAYQRWKSSLDRDFSMGLRGKTVSRLLLGHGLPSPVDVGLKVHHTWGVPIIPGSAVKGLLAHYIETHYGPRDPAHHPLDPAHPEKDRARFQGVMWDGPTIKYSPGEVYRKLFGAPDATTDDHYSDASSTTEDPPVGAARGKVQFHDAWMVPQQDSKKPFARDVLTVHQKTYYNADGKNESPVDYDEPNPVSFLTVKPGVKFLFALSGDHEWVEFASELLKRALAEWGIGGKTTAGYGRFDDEAWLIEPNPIEKIARNSTWAKKVDAWFDEHPTDGELSVKERLALFDDAFTTPLLTSPPDRTNRRGIWLVIDERIKKDSRTNDFRERWRTFLEDPEIDPQQWDLAPGDPAFPVDLSCETALKIGTWFNERLLDEEIPEPKDWKPEDVSNLSEAFIEAFFDELMLEEEVSTPEVREIVEFYLPKNDTTMDFWHGTLNEMLD